MRALLDTSVLVAGMLGRVRHSPLPPAQLWRRWRAKQFDLILSNHIFGELETALAQEWFADRMPPAERESAMRELRGFAQIVEVRAFVSGVAGHAEDDLVLAAAISGDA
jgi:predicted nucleic acid-binding protein